MSHAADASEIMEALTDLDPIYSVGVELADNSTVGAMRAWHVTLVSADAYEPIFADGYLLNGTNAAVSVRLTLHRSGLHALPYINECIAITIYTYKK